MPKDKQIDADIIQRFLYANHKSPHAVVAWGLLKFILQSDEINTPKGHAPY